MGQRSVREARTFEGGKARVDGAAVSRAGNGDSPASKENEVVFLAQGANVERGQGSQDASERGLMDLFGLLDLDRLFPRHDHGLQLGRDRR